MPTFRHAIDPNYKATRTPPPNENVNGYIRFEGERYQLDIAEAGGDEVSLFCVGLDGTLDDALVIDTLRWMAKQYCKRKGLRLLCTSVIWTRSQQAMKEGAIAWAEMKRAEAIRTKQE